MSRTNSGVAVVRERGRGPSGRAAAGAVAAVLAVVVSIGVFGGPRSEPQASPPVASAPLAAVASPGGGSATPSPGGGSARSPSPQPSPALVSGEGAPVVTSGPAKMLPKQRPPVRSGIGTLWANTASYWWAAADGQGAVWAWGQGPLARYVPTRDETTTWSVDDDIRFVADAVVASHSAGVWLVAGATIHRFDGSGFGESYDVGARVTAATEAPDGSVWAATADGFLVRLAGAQQTRIDGLGPTGNASINEIEIDARGDAWCAWSIPGEPYGGWLARYDGVGWRVFDDGLGDAPITALAALPDGSVWATAADRLTWFDGLRWTPVGARLPTSPPLAAGPDGALWFATGDQLARFSDLTWRTFASIRELVSDGSQATSVVPDPRGSFVAAGGSLYRRVGDRWKRVVAMRSAPPDAPEYAVRLIGVSHDEAWISGFDRAGDVALWHAVWREGAWSTRRFSTPLDVAQQLLRTPDGSLWAADGEHAVSILAGSKWTSAGGSTGGLAVDRHGTVWVADDTGGPMHVRSYALEHGAWVERGSTASTDLVQWPVSRIGIGRDGTIWVAGAGIVSAESTGLVRYSRGTWTMAHPLGAGVGAYVNDLVVAPNGDVWIAGFSPWAAGQQPDAWVARFDGRRWSVFRPAAGREATPLDFGGWFPPVYGVLAVGPDGTVWAAGWAGLYRYDGRAWTELYRGVRIADVSVANDGTVWVIGPSGVARLAGEMASQ